MPTKARWRRNAEDTLETLRREAIESAGGHGPELDEVVETWWADTVQELLSRIDAMERRERNRRLRENRSGARIVQPAGCRRKEQT